MGRRGDEGGHVDISGAGAGGCGPSGHCGRVGGQGIYCAS